MTAAIVQGMAVVADDPTRAPINARGGKPIYWPQIRTLTLADGKTVFGCRHCDYTNTKALSVRPHLKVHVVKPAPILEVACAATPSDPHPLVEVLAAERKRQGWSLSALSRRTGYSRTSLSAWERGLYDPSLTGVADLATALGIRLVLMRSQRLPVMEGQGALFEEAS